ncbi:hypothetical protein CEXT_12671 [Caerostris extrusa]|uniref:Uncharacterized protein n=1 Tax=Caerostris extrusa TaxID=172846 RepID=A0AAV4VXD9_CAEEX|nr:hypothetical protein CEXT_12671 [Caerostris extrusa]
MSFVERCYSLEEVTGSSVEDDNRNVHHIILMLRSGRAGRRCHLLGDLVPLKKHRAGMETMAEEMFIISFCCCNQEEQGEDVVCREILFP